jgi:histidine kinase
MSIRTRLLLSNIAMIIVPIILFILAVFLLVTVFFGGFQGMSAAFDRGHESQSMTPVEKEFIQLKKLSALSPRQLLNRNYLDSVSEKFEEEGAALVVRKKR